MAENPFELPSDVVEQNVKQAHAGCEQLNGSIAKATGAMPANPLATDFKVIQDRITVLAKENGDSVLGHHFQRTVECIGSRLGVPWITMYK